MYLLIAILQSLIWFLPWSVAYAMIVGAAARQERYLGIVVAMAGLLPAAWLLSWALFIQGVLTIVALLYFLKPEANFGAIARTTLSCSLLGYVLVLVSVSPRFLEVWQLRAQYPFESVRERLTYEQSAIQQHGDLSEAVELADAVEARLEDDEHWAQRATSDLRSRPFQLMLLHNSHQESFIATFRVFGVVRMLGLTSPDALMLPEPIPLPLCPDPETTPMADEVPLHHPDNLEGLHWAGRDEFLSPDRMGYVKDRNHVVGFVPHRFQSRPALNSNSTMGRWRISQLDLISLLKHETPVAYISDELPQMEKLKHAPTRSLDDFETISLEKLRTAGDLIIEEQADEIRMLGSLRARTDCLNCHFVQRGDLLGAFSYVLNRVHE